MKKHILFVALLQSLTLSVQAFALECGTQGNLAQRIASCGTKTAALSLVTEVHGSQIWLERQSNTLYHVDTETHRSWYESKAYCSSLEALYPSGAPGNPWTMPSYKTFPFLSLREGYKALRRPSSEFGEVRFWMKELFQHPSGRPWGAFFSNQEYFDTWFADAGDHIYHSACALKLQPLELGADLENSDFADPSDTLQVDPIKADGPKTARYAQCLGGGRELYVDFSHSDLAIPSLSSVDFGFRKGSKAKFAKSYGGQMGSAKMDGTTYLSVYDWSNVGFKMTTRDFIEGSASGNMECQFLQNHIYKDSKVW